MPSAQKIGRTIDPNGKTLAVTDARHMDQIRSNQLYPERPDKGFAYRAMLRMKQRRGQKRPFWLFRPFIAVFKLMGLIADEPSHKVEATMPKKKKQDSKSAEVQSKHSLFSWEGLVAKLGLAGAIAVAVFCVVAVGITFWNWVAGAAFIVICGCVPAVIIAAIAGYMGFQKVMNSREDDDDDEDEDKKE